MKAFLGLTNYFRTYFFLRSMIKHAFLSAEELQRQQNDKLRTIVKYAYEHSSFYNAKFKQAGIKPDDIRGVKDLNKLPITKKEELTGKVEEVVSNEYQVSKLRAMRTSGSTGRPLHFYISEMENEFRKAKHLRANLAYGQKPWDTWVTITSPLHFAESSRLQRLLKVYATSPVSVFDDLSTQFAKIEELKPDIIDGYSNSILLLAKEADKRGGAKKNPRFLIGGAELIEPGSRKFVERVFDAPFYDQYACVELERMAWQCEEKDEYHVDADSLMMQFVDEYGEEVAAGEKGEVVCTSLFNFAMPIIRYALDDVGVPSENTSCPCGRTFPLMKVLEGRKTSLLTFPSGRILAPFAFMLAMWTFKRYDSIDLFRIVQTRKDLLVFRLKLKPSVKDSKIVEEELVKHFRDVLKIPAEEVAFEVEIVDDIPMDKNGKFRIVLSELSLNQ